MDNTSNITDAVLLTIREYADAYSLGISTVRKYIRESKIDAFKNDDNQWVIRCDPDDIPVDNNTGDTTGLLLEEKNKQIQDLKAQVAFLQEILQQKIKSEERLQQIILSQSLPKLGFWQRFRMLFGQEEQVKNV